ncbi:hypothetical protein [Ancylobacter pratisalsi]|uniref:Uncharacterized protein n=1 Tax=Ancylobacter pratisalsi TaxID=1745854 RepID=A0A6P1YIM3_9HYPH|nr:hypothetical protein [Ancylobacter pratisalsi]QIB32982.1 hypothetical protein G3A50_04080 [Ancylobacter pratisalsi]
MGEKLTPAEMLSAARHLERLPYEASDLATIQHAVPAIVPKLAAKYEPAEGLCYLVSDRLQMAFVVVKSLRKRSIFGKLKPNYTIMMGFDHGDVWEQGPTVPTARAVAFVFDRMEKTDRWMDSEYGRKR